MNVKVLVENTSLSPAYRCEHGLSLYIETRNHKVLFDMGQGNLFLENAERMGVDIEAVDIAILSHGHYDHGGGIETFLKRNARAILYAHADVFQPHCARREDGRIDDIGLDSTIALNPRIQAPRRVLRIDDELCIFSGVVPHRLFTCFFFAVCESFGCRIYTIGSSTQEATKSGFLRAWGRVNFRGASFGQLLG